MHPPPPSVRHIGAEAIAESIGEPTGEPIGEPSDEPFASRHQLPVFLTADIEVWPASEDRNTVLRALERHIEGRTPEGNFGLPYQLEILKSAQLKATFFVEPLFSEVAGAGPLREIVNLIQSMGQEVQLHVHPEWGRHAQLLRRLPPEKQQAIIERGLNLLREAGATNVTAFRAGSFGANASTLPILSELGFRVDASYNPVDREKWQMRLSQDLSLVDSGFGGQGGKDSDVSSGGHSANGLVELPLTVLTGPGSRQRPAQICAISTAEMTHALDEAWRRHRRSFVVLWHGAEFVGRESFGLDPLLRGVRDRFVTICDWLTHRRSTFETKFVSEVEVKRVPRSTGFRTLDLPSPMSLVAERYAEQLVEALRLRLRRLVSRFSPPNRQ